ncbi:MAG TPA: phage tail protein [Capsulimonadaceae bacterium]|nr:phage tail protein [Capsulimonadaceae bacterium]
MSQRFPLLVSAAALLALFALTLGVAPAQAQAAHRGPHPKKRAMAGPGNILTAPRFVLQINGQAVASFQGLGGIKSEIEPTQYIYNDNRGKINHTKQYGKTNPPTVTLKRGIDSNNMLWAWHQKVRNNDPQARQDAVLILYSGKKRVGEYILKNAWPKKLNISGMKAGNSQVPMETVTLVCDSIQYVPAK